MEQWNIAIMCAAGMAELQAMKARTENMDRKHGQNFYINLFILYFSKIMQF